MSFDVAPDAYDRFMGRYSSLLAPAFVDYAFAAGSLGPRVLDVGCGPGALTGELGRRLGLESISAVDPSPQFVAATTERYPGIDIHLAQAEALPFADGEFDAALAQLVVHFMAEPVLGLQEMKRVTKPGGSVAACVWDHAGGGSPLASFWESVRDVDPDARTEAVLPGAQHGDLTRLFTEAGLQHVQETAVSVAVVHPTFEEWWQPFTLGVGPAGAYVAGLDASARQRLADHCRGRLPAAPFTINATAWAARGTA